MTEQVPPHSTLPPDTPTSLITSLWSRLNNVSSTLWATILAMFYLSGFVVLNAHLSRFGLSDFEFVSGRYLLAAANFAFFLICFYFFAGRTILLTPLWSARDLQHVNQLGPSRFWEGVVFIRLISRLFFSFCLSAATYTATALEQIEMAWVIALSGAFLVSYVFTTSGLDIRFPRTNLIVSIIIETVAIWAFVSGEGIINLIGVLAVYFLMAMYILHVSEDLKRNKINLDRIGFTTIYSAFMVLIIALGFGAALFGQVSSKVGGGRPSDITFSLDQEIRAVLPDSLVPEGKGPLHGQLVHQTEKYLYVNIADQTVRLRADDIAVIVLKPPQPWHPFSASVWPLPLAVDIWRLFRPPPPVPVARIPRSLLGMARRDDGVQQIQIRIALRRETMS